MQCCKHAAYYSRCNALCREQAEKKQASQNASSSLYGGPQVQPRSEDFPELKPGERIYQKNEGQWDFYLEESDDAKAVVLEVQLGKYMDTSLVKVRIARSRRRTHSHG